MTDAAHISMPLIALDNITIRLLDRLILPDSSWLIEKNQHWAVIGPNGAGKTSLMRALVGELPVVQGEVTFSGGKSFRKKISYISFERERRLIAREEDRDAARFFSGDIDNITTTRQMILENLAESDAVHHRFDRIVKQLGLAYLLERGIRFLSTGEMRKAVIARALLQSPRLLILDEPFDGLDVAARSRLAEIINNLMSARLQIILVTHRIAEVLPNISHILGLKKCRFMFLGSRNQVLNSECIERLFSSEHSFEVLPFGEDLQDARSMSSAQILVEMKNVGVRYKNCVVFKNLNWTVRRGENWAITGPNGAGKTTLMSLISGDNLQAYANEIFLFGKRRGTGESIWDIKKKIGMVSAEFQIRYRKPINALEVILSGFFDSVGLYRRSNPAQKDKASKWIEFIGLAAKAAEPFNRLSYGEQRLLLLARAMVKSPLLLILDEPCQGLDRTNRKMVLNLIDAQVRRSRTQILFITHHSEEIPDCISHLLRFEKGSVGEYFVRSAPRLHRHRQPLP
jgi:molybdate transport system ATP-binding protein